MGRTAAVPLEEDVMGELHDQVKGRVERIHRMYDELCAEVEDYRDWVKELVDAEKAKAEPDPKYVSAVGVQLRFSDRFLTVLEEQAFDELIHFADRVIRIKHYEDGVFI
jgi:hypothetical protein